MVAPFTRIGDPRARILAWAFAAIAAIVAASRGKPEYLVAALPLAAPSGAVALERSLAKLRPWLRRAGAGACALGLVGFTAIALPLVLPVLPVRQLVAYMAALGVKVESSEKKEVGALPQFYADMHGWPELAAAAAEAFATLSPDERRGAAVWAVTGGYGPAAAIDFFGPRYGLPRALSGHNNSGLWGPGGADGRAVVLLGGRRERLEPLFESLTLVTVLDCGYCMPYENQKPIYVGRGMKKSFASIWPELKHYE